MKKLIYIIMAVCVVIMAVGCPAGSEVTNDLNYVEAVIESGNTYTVTFEPNGAAGRAFSQSFRGGQSQALLRCKFTRAGYSFMGWATSADGTVSYRNNQQLILTEDMTLYAVWKAGEVNYTVERYFQMIIGGNNYEQLPGYLDLTESGVADTETEVTAETVDGFTAQPIEQQNIDGDGSTVVKVYYNRNHIYYTFNPNGGNWSGETNNRTIDGLFGAAVNIAPPMKVGYHYTWNSEVPATFGLTNATFTAQWTANTYKIIFHANNGGDNTSDQTMTYDEENNLTTNSFTRTGWTFQGWAENSSAVSENYTNEQNVSNLTAENNGTVDLYAVWRLNKYKISFNGNNADSGSMSDIEDVEYGETVTLSSNEYIKSGFTFVRWCDNQYGVGKSFADGANVQNLTDEDNGTVTLYAIWKDDTNYINASGNIVIGGVEYEYTSFKKVMDETADIVGSDDNWSSYLDSSAPDNYKGVFISGRTVKLSPYNISKYQITQSIYEKLMETGTTYNRGSGDYYPAYYVSWNSAITFCNKLSLLMGKEPCYSLKENGEEIDWANYAYSSIPTNNNAAWNAVEVNMNANGYRLPTMAEWEFAARGGDPNEPDWYYAFSGINVANGDMIYDGISYLPEDANLSLVSWYKKNTSSTQPVGSKIGNRLGLYDMSGNVQELCWDWYNENVTTDDDLYTKDGVVINPLGAVGGSKRCIRGGHYRCSVESCTVTLWYGRIQYEKSDCDGFRIACTE